MGPLAELPRATCILREVSADKIGSELAAQLRFQARFGFPLIDFFLLVGRRLPVYEPRV